jgi:GNAT superfamily N-acetyltransferase
VTTRTWCSVRHAEPDDAAQVATLLAELGYPGNQVADVRQRLDLWANETTSRVLVGERHKQVLGIIAVTAIPYLEHAGRWGRIVALVVSSTCRGRGVGRQLVQAAEEAASELGCVVMEVTTALSRTDSHLFYQALGYEDWALPVPATSRISFPAPL